MRNQASQAVRPAFTLVELLVVIAIIGILVSLLLAGDSGRTRSGPACSVPEQSPAARHRNSELPRCEQEAAGRSLLGRYDGRLQELRSNRSRSRVLPDRSRHDPDVAVAVSGRTGAVRRHQQEDRRRRAEAAQRAADRQRANRYVRLPQRRASDRGLPHSSEYGQLSVELMKTYKMSNYAASRGPTKHINGGTSCSLTSNWNNSVQSDDLSEADHRLSGGRPESGTLADVRRAVHADGRALSS